MTYLNLVNNVLRRLREDEVSSVQDNTYSKLVGDFVNDAKRMVEDAWDWSALRTTLTVTTSAGTFNYVLTGSQNRIKVLYHIIARFSFIAIHRSIECKIHIPCSFMFIII